MLQRGVDHVIRNHQEWTPLRSYLQWLSCKPSTIILLFWLYAFPPSLPPLMMLFLISSKVGQACLFFPLSACCKECALFLVSGDVGWEFWVTFKIVHSYFLMNMHKNYVVLSRWKTVFHYTVHLHNHKRWRTVTDLKWCIGAGIIKVCILYSEPITCIVKAAFPFFSSRTRRAARELRIIILRKKMG